VNGFPQARVQTCIVHLVRASLDYVGCKERKQVAADLKAVYRAATAGEAEQRLAQFAAQWDSRYAAIALRPLRGAQKARGLDCGPRRPNNPTIRGEGKKEKFCSGPNNRDGVYTKSCTLPGRPGKPHPPDKEKTIPNP
jgi:hypothetical protein